MDAVITRILEHMEYIQTLYEHSDYNPQDPEVLVELAELKRMLVAVVVL